MIAATLLTPEPVTICNVPDIADVAAMLDAAKSFGAKVTRDAKAGTVTLCTPKVKTAKIDAALAAKIRTSFLFAGPLLARVGRASLPPPGGDQIGHRRLDTHFAGFRSLGAKTVAGRKTLRFKGELKGAKILLDEASVTATENILMASVLARGRTVIFNAACEPHIVDLATMLNAMGAKIAGAGTNRIEVEGVESLHGCEATVGCDYIEAGSYIVAAAVTGGELTLTGVDPAPFEILEGAFARFGVTWTIDAKERTLRYVPKKRLKMKYDLGDAIPSVADGTWPAFPSDLMSILIVLATQTRGTCLFFEKMFESRLYFVDHLRQMGANRAVRPASRRRDGSFATLRRNGDLARHTRRHLSRDCRARREGRVDDSRCRDRRPRLCRRRDGAFAAWRRHCPQGVSSDLKTRRR